MSPMLDIHIGLNVINSVVLDKMFSMGSDIFMCKAKFIKTFYFQTADVILFLLVTIWHWRKLLIDN